MARSKIILLVAMLCMMMAMSLSANVRAKDRRSRQKDSDKVARGAMGGLICSAIISFQATTTLQRWT